jgi:hypothetical protein
MPPRKGPGRRPIRGKPLKKLSAVLKDPKVPWQRHRVSLWYSPRVRCTIARALLGGGDLVGSRAIGVPLKIAWELGPSPRSGGQDALARAVFKAAVHHSRSSIVKAPGDPTPWLRDLDSNQD